MKTIPAVTKYMTAMPHSIGAEQTLATAARKMRELNIRHLPVLHGGKLIGVLSDRELRVIESLQGVEPEAVKVEEAMSPEVHQVAPTAKLDEVVAHMAEHKLGSTLIVDGGKCVGIFTTVDVCRALAELLRS
jgi:acetoin utilization protein AcuB